MRKEYDLSKMKKVKHPTATKTSKVGINIRLDMDLVAWLRDEADRRALPYQTLINSFLKERMNNNVPQINRDDIRSLIREELKKTGNDR